jgi:hypothetical protein
MRMGADGSSDEQRSSSRSNLEFAQEIYLFLFIYFPSTSDQQQVRGSCKFLFYWMQLIPSVATSICN